MRSTCVFLLHGFFIHLVIEWEALQDFVAAREHIAKQLGAQFLYANDETST